jgi:hypothetical protein
MYEPVAAEPQPKDKKSTGKRCVHRRRFRLASHAVLERLNLGTDRQQQNHDFQRVAVDDLCGRTYKQTQVHVVTFRSRQIGRRSLRVPERNIAVFQVQAPETRVTGVVPMAAKKTAKKSTKAKSGAKKPAKKK